MTYSKSLPNKMEMNKLGSTRPDSLPIDTEKVMSKARILKNLIVVCLGFLCLFTAYQALANLQSTMNIEGNLGVVSQSVIYAALIVSSLFLPKLVIKKFGCKLTLLLSILTYAPYVAANFYPHMATFVPTAILLGLGAAPLWSAKCTYINEISSMYANHGTDSVDVVTSKFFGIFFMIFQNTQIWGNLVSFFVLKPSQNETQANVSHPNQSFSDSYIKQIALSTSNFNNGTCGINFWNETNENLEPPSDDKRYMLISIYLGCVILGSIIITFFLDPLKRKEEHGDDGIFSRAIATFKHMKKPQQLLLIPLTIFSGIEQAFILGDYTKAYVGCTWGVYRVGLVFICFGVVNAIMSFLSGRIVKYVSRKFLVLTGALGNIGVCTALFLWTPTQSEFIYAFVIVGVWGLSDAIWQTQINALYGVLFRSEEEAAFANYRLWESLGFSLAFAYSSFLDVPFKIYILLTFLVVGTLGYIIVDLKVSRHDSYSVTEPNSLK